MTTYTEFCQNKLTADFTGVLYSDTGRLNYAAAINGKILKNNRRMNRWFKTCEAAKAALQSEA